MRTLAIDLGERRIGLAMSDPLGMLASPFGTLEAMQPKLVARRLNVIISENEVNELVVGLPLRTEGTDSAQTDRVRAWAEEVRPLIAVPIVFVDERFSTKEAAGNLRAAGESSASMRDRLDAAAATVVLQSYLDLKRVQGSGFRVREDHGVEDK